MGAGHDEAPANPLNNLQIPSPSPSRSPSQKSKRLIPVTESRPEFSMDGARDRWRVRNTFLEVCSQHSCDYSQYNATGPPWTDERFGLEYMTYPSLVVGW